MKVVESLFEHNLSRGRSGFVRHHDGFDHFVDAEVAAIDLERIIRFAQRCDGASRIGVISPFYVLLHFFQARRDAFGFQLSIAAR
jgi:hypothetical protein